jgi:predicted  nucleic acid-binding Zn ribbon protein
MYVVELSFNRTKEVDPDAASGAVHSLLGALRKNGQICEEEWRAGSSDNGYQAFVLLPDSDALDAAHHSLYVRNALEELLAAGLDGPHIRQLGKDIDGVDVCACVSPTSHILFTNYLFLESPLRCGDCFSLIPLYRIPHTRGEDHSDITSWQSDYKSCDSLQMNSATLERAATREMSRFDSSLSKRGRELAAEISRLTGKPTYYCLYRYGGRSRAQERKRLCPSCGGAWLLDAPWHRLFDFKCDKCHLLSNIAWDVR